MGLKVDLYCVTLVASYPSLRRAKVGLDDRVSFLFFNDSVTRIIWTFTGPIFTQFAGMIELWLYENKLIGRMPSS